MKLETERLLLREWRQEDIDDLIEGLNNLEISKWMAFVPHPYTREDAQKWIDFCIESSGEREDRTFYKFAIELKSEHKVIGGMSLDKIDKVQGTSGSGGIWIHKKYQGK